MKRMRPDAPCSNCGGQRETAAAYCRACGAAYMRAWRAAGRERITAEHVRRDTARSIAAVYQSRGKLEVKAECERCGSTEHVEKHHPDYARPLEVEWVCRVCHELEPKDEILPDRAERRPLMVT